MLEISASTLSLAASIATIICMFAMIVKVSMRIGALELKVDTMWSFAMRRAMSEAVTTGIGTMNSPLAFTDDSYQRLEPIKDALLEFGKTIGTMSDHDALLEIEKQFGKQLLEMVAPSGMPYDAFLLLALSVAKGGEPGNHTEINV